MKYEIRTDERGLQALYRDRKRITKWFKRIRADSFLEGKSEYFVAVFKDESEALFDSEGRQISKKFYCIDETALASGFNFYLALFRDVENYVLLDVNENLILGPFKKVYSDEFFQKESNFMIALDSKSSSWKVFYDLEEVASDLEDVHDYFIDGFDKLYVLNETSEGFEIFFFHKKNLKRRLIVLSDEEFYSQFSIEHNDLIRSLFSMISAKTFFNEKELFNARKKFVQQLIKRPKDHEKALEFLKKLYQRGFRIDKLKGFEEILNAFVFDSLKEKTLRSKKKKAF